MFLSDWQGFTEFDFPKEMSLCDLFQDYSISTLPDKTQLEYSLKTYTIHILDLIMELSTEQGNMNSMEDMDAKAREIAESFAIYPQNIRNESSSSSVLLEYLNHPSALLDMVSVRDGRIFLIEDMPVLGLMLINEAMRLEGDDSTIAAMEAVEAIEITISDNRGDEKIHRIDRNRMIILTQKRHEKSNELKSYAKAKAKDLKVEKPHLTAPQIRDQISPDVATEAGEIGMHMVTDKTLYDWVLAALK